MHDPLSMIVFITVSINMQSFVVQCDEVDRKICIARNGPFWPTPSAKDTCNRY